MKDLVADIKTRIREEICRIRTNKELMGRIYLISLGMALLVLAVAVKVPEQKGRVLSDSSGRALEIERNSMDNSETYDFEVSIQEGDETMLKDVNLRLQAVGEDTNDSVIASQISREDEINAALDSAVSEIEDSRSEKIKLPDELSDGTKISWRRLDKKDYTSLVLLPTIYIAMLIFVIRYSREKNSDEARKRRSSIIRGLPRFCNQLHLMMNAGLILSDAFELITESYEAKQANSKGDSKYEDNYFERELVRIQAKDPERRKSSADIIKEFAVKNDVKEMIRIATILTENEKRGSDVIESLSRESRYLWDERKIVAREKGKLIDTKMSYPLSILLILLIVITMAPAMLSM